jgi:hypothetical protein
MPTESDGDPTPELQAHSRYPAAPEYTEVLRDWGLVVPASRRPESG